MRETPRSLRAYFLLVGILSVLGSVIAVRHAVTSGDGFIIGLYSVNSVMGLAYIYVGAKLVRLLCDKPQVPLQLATAAIFLSLLSFSILGMLLNIYIYYQLKRMAREATPEMESQVLE